MEPIELHQIINYDFTLTFVQDSSDNKEALKGSLARISEASPVRGVRNITSSWVNNEDVKHNILEVK